MKTYRASETGLNFLGSDNPIHSFAFANSDSVTDILMCVEPLWWAITNSGDVNSASPGRTRTDGEAGVPRLSSSDTRLY
jgi:hypothetical protein